MVWYIWRWRSLLASIWNKKNVMRREKTSKLPIKTHLAKKFSCLRLLTWYYAYWLNINVFIENFLNLIKMDSWQSNKQTDMKTRFGKRLTIPQTNKFAQASKICKHRHKKQWGSINNSFVKFLTFFVRQRSKNFQWGQNLVAIFYWPLSIFEASWSRKPIFLWSKSDTQLCKTSRIFSLSSVY